jgi:parallel beta-helix repeat protein
VNDHSVGGETGSGAPNSDTRAGVTDWNCIKFYSSSVDNLLRHVIVKYGGQSYTGWEDDPFIPGALEIFSSSVQIANSEFSDNSTGIYIKDASPTIVYSNILNNKQRGIHLDNASPEIKGCIIKGNDPDGIGAWNGSLPTITGNTFENNIGFAVYNFTPSAVVIAQNNNWGDPSGPLDQYDDRTDGGWYNPDGQGDRVSDHVNYQQWTGNDPPVIMQGETVTIVMDEDGVPTAFDLILDAIDVDNDTLTWSVKTLAKHGTAMASGTGNSKSISYSPEENYNGTDSFVIQVSDGYTGGVDNITVNVTIKSISDLKGDLNGDFEIDFDDAMIAFKALVNLEPGAREDYISSGVDVNGDNKIGSEELIYIMQQLSKS